MIRYIIISLFLFLPLIAEETAPKPFDIQAHIVNIKTAKASERRVLMNQLKLQLRQMNKESRVQVIKELQTSFAKGKRQQNQNIRRQYPQHQSQHRMGNGQGRGGK
ncbi:MAG: hypothetical protein K0U38_10190 [Epsilonproteobacteria bacterium]|nr:hypothetical protein [Campylobacterota bacterium]